MTLERSGFWVISARMAAVVDSTRAGSSALTTTEMALDVKPAASEISIDVPVGLDGREVGDHLLGLRAQVDRRIEADRDGRAVGGPAALGGEDRLEAGVALAGDARLDELHVRIGEQDLLGLGRLLEHGGGATCRPGARA